MSPDIRDGSRFRWPPHVFADEPMVVRNLDDETSPVEAGIALPEDLLHVEESFDRRGRCFRFSPRASPSLPQIALDRVPAAGPVISTIARGGRGAGRIGVETPRETAATPGETQNTPYAAGQFREQIQQRGWNPCAICILFWE